MRKVNTKDIVEILWKSPKGKFASADKMISEELGRDPKSTDLKSRHPFDVEICRVPAGTSMCPYHLHSAQWEFYLVTGGSGQVRDKEGVTAVEPGDAFIFGPGEAHQLTASPTEDLVVMIVADNPVGETCYYPDSKKWAVHSPSLQLIRSEELDYLDGEE